MPNSLTRMAYVLSMRGPDVKQTVVDYVRAQANLSPDAVASAQIMVSYCGTGILDFGPEYSALTLKAGGAILISQIMLHKALAQHFDITGAGFEVAGTTFELPHHYSDSKYPIEDCDGFFLITRRISTNTPAPDLLALIQQLFRIHQIDFTWFWSAGAAPASLATTYLVVAGEAAALARFIDTVVSTNTMSPRDQLIDLGSALARDHGNWLVRNPNVIDALLARQHGLTDRLIDELKILKRVSFN